MSWRVGAFLLPEVGERSSGKALAARAALARRRFAAKVLVRAAWDSLTGMALKVRRVILPAPASAPSRLRPDLSPTKGEEV
jgi:hypothetical protein